MQAESILPLKEGTYKELRCIEVQEAVLYAIFSEYGKPVQSIDCDLGEVMIMMEDELDGEEILAKYFGCDMVYAFSFSGYSGNLSHYMLLLLDFDEAS